MNTKQLYTAPEADLLVIRFEENIMSPNYGSNGSAGANQNYNEYGPDF